MQKRRDSNYDLFFLSPEVMKIIDIIKTQTLPTPLGSVCSSPPPPDTVPAYRAPL